jgi:protoporphyrinogen oxidase
MGLACAWELLLGGHRVTVYEADRVVGGMSASFDFDGLRIERFYHFICTGDEPFFALLHELGIDHLLRWRETRMGYFHGSRLSDWGNPLALLSFPGLGLAAKLRYGFLAWRSVRRHDWRSLDALDAASWIRGQVGEEAWRVLWKPLFDLKFHEYTADLSAAWIWARLRRVGASRRNLMQEQLGYLEGGSEAFLNTLVDAIRSRGGVIRTGERVEEVTTAEGSVKGLRTAQGHAGYDAVISTIPLPFVPRMIPSLDAAQLAAYRALQNIAVVCVLARLRRPLTPYFWLNISDPAMDIPGLVEYTNLRPLDGHVVYIPWYLPGDSAAYARPDEWFTTRTREHLLRVQPDFRPEDILSVRAGRYRYAQPICPPRFLSSLPPAESGIDGLLIADTSHYYPEDRSISESVKLGRELARRVPR